MIFEEKYDLITKEFSKFKNHSREDQIEIINEGLEYFKQYLADQKKDYVTIYYHNGTVRMSGNQVNFTRGDIGL
jgi:hypothetical protein